MYTSLIRPLLFLFDPEKIHHFTFSFLKLIHRIPGVSALTSSLFSINHPSLERNILGLNFKNPVGLAAGFDKDARLIDELSCFGFGSIEIGTLTPKAQPGNDKPRLFRLPADGAVINRMGFNNEGAIAAAERLKNRRSSVIVGGNIGKNKITPNEEAVKDYEIAFEALYPYVDYFVINVSSPNTPNLRQLQEKGPLKELMSHMKKLSESKPKVKPVLLKIAPDLNEAQLDDIVEILKETHTDGVIATNTTIARSNLKTSDDLLKNIGNGGLSGAPLRDQSNEVISYLRKKLGKDFPIIGVGGVMSPEDAIAKLNAGADLVQVYTGFIYYGPSLVKAINKAIVARNSK